MNKGLEGAHHSNPQFVIELPKYYVYISLNVLACTCNSIVLTNGARFCFHYEHIHTLLFDFTRDNNGAKKLEI